VITERTRSGIIFAIGARSNTAQAPADQADLAPMRVAELVHQIDHRILHAFARTEVAALTPAADGIAAALQEACAADGSTCPKRPARATTSTGWPSPLGARLSSGNAPRKAPSSWIGAPLQQHQGSGRRAQAVWAVADIVAPFRIGPLSFGNRPMDQQEDCKPRRIVPQRNKIIIKAREPDFPFQAAHSDAARVSRRISEPCRDLKVTATAAGIRSSRAPGRQGRRSANR